jgi:hypothetical protein
MFSVCVFLPKVAKEKRVEESGLVFRINKWNDRPAVLGFPSHSTQLYPALSTFHTKPPSTSALATVPSSENRNLEGGSGFRSHKEGQIAEEGVR